MTAIPDLTRPLHRDGRYQRVWGVGWLSGVVRWLELLAYGILAWDLTGSPSLVALLTLLRFVPMALFSQVIGAAADLVDLRRMMIWSLIGAIAVSCVMLGVQLSGSLVYWHLCLSAFATGVYWASDMPIRRTMMGQIAGDARLARAMSWDYATSNGTRMVGPLVGGVLYQTVGMDGVFLLIIAHYLAALWLAVGLPHGAPIEGTFRPGAVFTNAWHALRHALRDNDAVSIMAITIIFNIWVFPYVSMIPVIGKEDLGLSDSVIGMIASLEGGASLVVVFLIGLFAGPRVYRILYASGAVGAMAIVAFMGLTPGLLPMALGLLATGALTACFAGMQATLMYRAAPPDMRARYLGLISFCIGAGLLGFANVGLTAELFGAKAAMWIIAAEGAIPLLIVLARWRALHADLGLSR